jgi:type I restriction enzyme, S subunit
MSVLENIDLTKAIESKLDRSKWVKWKFSDLVENIVEKVVPKDSGLEHYIGLEHLDSGSLKIRRFGETESLIGDKLKIYKGDLIFAKRNAYLKRVAIADFDAVASAHSLVLRPKSKNVLPEFLPFFLLSEVFWQRAIEISVGSLSPTINWKVLAKQEFLLPPKEEQTKIAELLWAMDEVIEREKEVLENVNIIQRSFFKKFSVPAKNWTKHQIKDLMRLHYGSALKESDRVEGDYSVITSSGCQGTHKKYITEGPGIVVGRKGNVGQVTWVENNFWTTDTAYYIEILDGYKNLPIKFFYYLLVASNLKKHSIATAVPGLNRDDALMTKVYLPEENEILDIVNKFDLIDSQKLQIESKILSSQLLQKSLINQVF